jgi:hypothetical protein
MSQGTTSAKHVGRMGGQRLLSPTSSLGRRATPEARAFLQRRVALYGTVLVSLLSGFFVVVNIINLVRPFGGHVHERMCALMLVAIAINASVWAIAARSRELGADALCALEAGSTLACCTIFAAMGFVLPPAALPHNMIALSITNALAARAVIVPANARWSAFVGVVSGIPGLIVVYLVYSVSPPPPPMSATTQVMFTVAWLLLAVAGSTLTSAVIYGLQRQVAKAMQLGQYTLGEKIGEGGMGAVYRATHALLRRPTAIKLLPPDKTGEQALVRFEREVQLTSMLTHPNTIAIYDFGRTPDGIFYYAMEYLDGLSLDELVAKDGPQSPARVIYILRQVCGALAEAHAAGLIHRDIKPANIVLCNRGGAADVAKVLDFGLVKQTSDDGAGDLALTGTNTITGTPRYLAPEAITSPEKVDARSDLYALGAVGYYLLAGRDVFEETTLIEICSHHLHTRPDAPSTKLGAALPEDLETVILGCLEKAPAARPQDARALEHALAECAAAGVWNEDAGRAWWEKRARAT